MDFVKFYYIFFKRNFSKLQSNKSTGRYVHLVNELRKKIVLILLIHK